MSKRSIYIGALLAVIGALVIAGCGGGGGSSSSSPEPSGGENASQTSGGGGGSGTIGGSEIEGLGSVLVDSEGMTVYEFTPDEGTTSTCYGECESVWPPVAAEGKPTAGEGASSSALGTTKRKDGTMQVTYEGHPLYTFSGDKAAGEANGQEIEGIWFVLDESGNAVKGKGNGSAPAASEESEEGGSGGYGGY